MSNMSKNSLMPYHLEQGAMEMMKIRSKAAVARAAATKNDGKIFRWSVSIAVVTCAFLALFVFVDSFKPTHYELLMEQVAEAPVDGIYEFAADIVEYAEDTTLL